MMQYRERYLSQIFYCKQQNTIQFISAVKEENSMHPEYGEA